MSKRLTKAYSKARSVAEDIGIWTGFVAAVGVACAVVVRMLKPFSQQGFSWVETGIIALGCGMLFISFLSLCMIGLAALKYRRTPPHVDRTDEVLAALSLISDMMAADRKVLFAIDERTREAANK